MSSNDNDGNKEEGRLSSYDVFGVVDELVSKPVIGSDGAALWQEFRTSADNRHNDHKRKQQHPHTSNRSSLSSSSSVAPKAPLKHADRAMGLKSWDDERNIEVETRQRNGDVAMESGYTNFKPKHDAIEHAKKKKEKQIESRIRPDDKEYYIPSKTFNGWKFDYIYTTRDHGTGYYWDGMDSVKKQRGEDIGAPDEEKDSSVAHPKEPKNKKKIKRDKKDGISSKKRRKLEGPVIVDNPNHPLEQVAAALQRKQQQQAMMMASNSSSNLPAGWEMTIDPSTSKPYYFNRSTGKQQWDKPTDEIQTLNEPGVSAAAPSKPKGEDESLPAGWSIANDPTTGKQYYYNQTSGETKWDRPTI